MKEQKFELKVGNKILEVKIKNLAEQANGSVLVQYGDTVVLATCCLSKKEKENVTFLPLTVNYEERYYAAGKIYGPRFTRRESRPSSEAIVTTRLIDRVIRPLFPDYLKQEVQVIVTCLSWDGENDPDIIGLLAASIALLISDIPWQGPVAPVRIGRINGKFILNPTYKEREESNLDIVFSALSSENLKEDKKASDSGEPLINMLEVKAGEVEEDLILKAIEFSKEPFKKLLAFQKKIRKELGKEKLSIKEIKDPELEKEIKKFLGKKLQAAMFSKTERTEKTDELREELLNFVEQKYAEESKIEYAANFFEKQAKEIMHENIIKYNRRPDGRKLNEVRKINCETGLLPRTHGSGLFCRGRTKSLSVLTLGAPGDYQILQGMEIVGEKRFIHHYNFPPYSVGETKPLRGPGRRDIGHGMLAEKALESVLPSFKEFPYTIRIVSEILSSNGSTSMASVSSSSLSLMDAGVPIKKSVAGIAIGLMVKEEMYLASLRRVARNATPVVSTDRNTDYKILTDIQGPEDHYGDMDLKIAGTKKGITVMQMDVKIRGINQEIFKQALRQARECRLQILEEIKKVIKAPRPHLSPFAPKIYTLEIDPEKIGEIIGYRGKTINEITESTGVTIDIQPSGLIFVTSEDEESLKKAVDWIRNIGREIKVGETFQGRIKRILDFGAFVQITPNKEGLIHISKLAPYRVNKVQDIVKIGDTVLVKVISIDEQGRINLSLQETNKKRY